MSTDATRSADSPDGPTVSQLPNPDATVSPPGATAPPPSDVPTLPPGFVFVEGIARGGMGMVYLARQIGLNRLCAIKVVAAAESKSLIRFLAEAELVAAIRHPNVVEVYQYGEHGGHPYLALEYCPGGDLSKLVSHEAKTSAGSASAPQDPAWFRKVAKLMVVPTGIGRVGTRGDAVRIGRRGAAVRLIRVLRAFATGVCP